MRKMFSYLFILLVFCLPIFGRQYFVLGGFKIGQKIADIKSAFPKLKLVHTYPDKVQVFGLKLKDYQVLLETHPSNPALVWTIQISGDSNPEFYGLDTLNLGTAMAEVISAFGQPLSQKEGMHEILEKPFKSYHYYSENANYSFESVDEKLNSIKIMFNAPPVDMHGSPAELIAALKAKNYYRAAELIDVDCVLEANKKQVGIKGSIIEIIRKDPVFKKLLLDPKTGLVSLEVGDITGPILRVFDDGKTANVYSVGGTVKKEIVFIRGHTGYGLWELNPGR